MTRVTDQVRTNTQLFMDKLWKQSDRGKEVLDINIDELGKINQKYKDIVKTYLIYLRKIGCIAYDCVGDHYLVAVKRKEAVQ